MTSPLARVPNRVTEPRRPEARLAALWVGHATVLVQLEDRFLLTDPVFTTAVGQFSQRLVEPGIAVQDVPRVDAVVISHMHFDHLSQGSLGLLEDRLRVVYVPRGAMVYVPPGPFDARELGRWASHTVDGLRVTAVPVEHVGWRYGADAAWMTESFTGYVVEHRGVTVYFGGDTAYAPELFQETARRFPHIDLALLPIGPIHPRAVMARRHLDPEEALRAFELLGARWMVPIHFDTFVNSQDAPGEARRVLLEAMARRGVGDDRVAVLPLGGQRVFLTRAP
jgi:L-ascorbate metabolism protein UlaG (beta-lactamase superfamily)